MRRWFPVSLIFIALISLTACQPADASSSSGASQVSGKACDTWVTEAPEAVKINNLVAVRTTTKSACDAVPDAHVVHITMEYRTNRSQDWALAYRADQCRELPRPGAFVRCQAHGFGICKAGSWRTRVLVTGTGPNGAPFAFELPEKIESVIWECPKV